MIIMIMIMIMIINIIIIIIYNVCTDLGACRTHKGGGGGGGGQAQSSLHESSLGGIEKLSLTLPHQGIESSDFNSADTLTTPDLKSNSLTTSA